MDEMTKARESATRVVRRIMNKLKSMVFELWNANAVRNRSCRIILARTAAKWRCKNLSAAISAWACTAAELQELRAREIELERRAQLKEVEAKNEQYRRECVMRRVTKHWKSRALSKMFRAWGCKTDDAARLRSVCKRTVLRIMHMRVARVFSVWDERVSESLRYKVSKRLC